LALALTGLKPGASTESHLRNTLLPGRSANGRLAEVDVPGLDRTGRSARRGLVGPVQVGVRDYLSGMRKGGSRRLCALFLLSILILPNRLHSLRQLLEVYFM